MKIATILFAIGLICVALGAGLFQFVIIGLLGITLLAIAFLVLFAAGIVTFCVSNTTMGLRKLVGGMFYLSGVFLLLASAAYMSALGYAAAISSQRSTVSSSGLLWLYPFAFSILAAFIIIVALRYGTKWPSKRCYLWGASAFGTMPAALILFWLFSTFLPLTA